MLQRVAGERLWWRVGTSPAFQPVMCSYLILSMTDGFGLFYISESKNRGFVFEKQIKIRELAVWVIRKHGRTSSFPETTGKEPTVRKAFFFIFQNI